jgi:hypothetical protein
LAGFFAFIWSNLCTRHIRGKLTPRGHHDWPDKRALLIFAGQILCCAKSEAVEAAAAALMNCLRLIMNSFTNSVLLFEYEAFGK